jgi:Tfp pilus assembly protein PilF
MARDHRRLTGVIGLGLALLAGCRHHPRTAPGPFPDPVPEPRAQLTAPQVADVQTALGQTLERRGDVGPAARAYEAALQADPARADVGLRLAALKDQQGQFTESADLYQRAVEQQPHNPDVYCNLGYSRYLQHRWGEAEQALRQAIALKADHRRAHNNLGLVLARAGRKEEALAEFRRAGCTEADAQINLAYALSLNAAWPDATRHYERALALQPDSAAARDGLAAVKTLSAKLQTHPSWQAAGGAPAAPRPGRADPAPAPVDRGVVPAVGSDHESRR